MKNFTYTNILQAINTISEIDLTIASNKPLFLYHLEFLHQSLKNDKDLELRKNANGYDLGYWGFKQNYAYKRIYHITINKFIGDCLYCVLTCKNDVSIYRLHQLIINNNYFTKSEGDNISNIELQSLQELKDYIQNLYKHRYYIKIDNCSNAISGYSITYQRYNIDLGIGNDFECITPINFKIDFNHIQGVINACIYNDLQKGIEC